MLPRFGGGDERAVYMGARINYRSDRDAGSGEVGGRAPAIVGGSEHTDRVPGMAAKRFAYVRIAEACITPGRSLPPKTIVVHDSSGDHRPLTDDLPKSLARLNGAPAWRHDRLTRSSAT